MTTVMMHKSYPFVGRHVTRADALPIMPPVAFLGREDLLASVKRQLDVSGAVLLHGVEGVGKTTVAAALTALLAGKLAGGVVWINAGPDDLGTLCDQMGRAFDDRHVIDAPSPEIKLERVHALLAEKNPLIVLDNVANPQAAREFLRAVASRLSVLLTASEQLPGPWMPVAVDPLSRKAAVSLFYRQSGLTPNDHINDIAALCGQVEHQPLAVELAARMVASNSEVTPGVLLGALPSRYDLPPGTSLVHSILRVALKRLPPGEQAVFMVLGGTFTASATVALLSPIVSLEPVYVERAINRLEARGLVHTMNVGGNLCAVLHNAVYQFARNLLDSSGRLADAEARTVNAVIDYAEEHTGDDLALQAEWGNILGALDFSARDGNAADVSAVARSVANSTLMTIHGHARLHQQMALVSAGGGDIPAEAVPPAVEAADIASKPPEVPAVPSDETLPAVPIDDGPGQGLIETGDQLAAEGNPEAAIESYAQALQAAQQAGDSTMAGRALIKLGQTSDLTGEHENAVQCYRQAMDIPDPPTQSLALASLGATFMAMGQSVKAMSAYKRAIPALQQTGQSVILARTYNNLGLALAEHGQLNDALENYRLALEAAREAGDLAAECDALLYAGDIHRQNEDYEPAIDVYRQALSLGETSGERGVQERALGAIGFTMLELSDLESAAESLALASAISQGLGTEGQERDWIGYLAQVYQDLERYEEATAAYTRAIELAREAKDTLAEAAYLNDLALLLTWRDQRAEAVELYEQAIALVRDIPAPADEAVFLSNLGMAYMDMGKAATAIEYYQQALDISLTLGDRQQEANALGNLGVAYGAIGRWENALEFHRQALEIWREANGIYEQSYHLGNIGKVNQVLGEREQAMRFYRDALDIAYHLGDAEGQATWLYHLGSVLMDDVPYVAEAVSMLQESYKIRLEHNYSPAGESQRRLKRAQARLERTQKACLEILPPSTAEERREAAGAMVVDVVDEDIPPPLPEIGEDTPPFDLPE